MTFYEKMSLVCLAIPEGTVATYGQIAMLCGKPGNSRQVGYGLREGLPSACEQVHTSCGQGENGKGEGQNHKKLWNNFVDFFRKMRII